MCGGVWASGCWAKSHVHFYCHSIITAPYLPTNSSGRVVVLVVAMSCCHASVSGVRCSTQLTAAVSTCGGRVSGVLRVWGLGFRGLRGLRVCGLGVWGFKGFKGLRFGGFRVAAFMDFF